MFLTLYSGEGKFGLVKYRHSGAIIENVYWDANFNS